MKQAPGLTLSDRRAGGHYAALTILTVLVLCGCGGSGASAPAGSSGALPPTASATATVSPHASPSVSPSPTPIAYEISVEPDEQGRSLLEAISRARTSVDIVVYEISAPQINRALTDAIVRGVNVRLVVNSQWYVSGNDTSSLQFAYQMQALLARAAAAPGAGRADVHWSSENFQITHQKTVVIDALGKDGRPLAAGALPSYAHAHVLTGNLNAVGYDTTTPQTCPSPCNFWSARDFYIKVADATLVAEIERVFQSDFDCAPRDATNDLRTTTLPLTWSNGSTGVNPGDAANQYPLDGNYPGFPTTNPSPNAPDPGPGIDQGNARQRMLDVIDNATQTLDVYNEEMNDNQVVNALAAASQRLGPGAVRVVMTQNASWDTAFKQLAQAGAAVHLYANASNILYIHAKVIMADRRTAYIGSTNISSDSMNYNRELGLLLRDRPDALKPVIDTFERDFANPQGQPFVVTKSPPPARASGFTPPQSCGTVTPP